MYWLQIVSCLRIIVFIFVLVVRLINLLTFGDMFF